MIKIGDMAYIPSDAMLKQMSNKGYISGAVLTDEPKIVLITDIRDRNYEILYNGQRWEISKKSVYPINAKELKEFKNVGNIDGSSYAQAYNNQE